MVIKIKSLSSLVLLFVVFNTISCKKAETINKGDIEINKILIKNIGDFNFKDSLIVAVEKSTSYEISIEREPSNADIYFSKLGDVFEKQLGSGIIVDSSFTNLFFYAKQEDYNQTEIKKISFAYKTGNLISDIKCYPNPCKEVLFVVFNVDSNIIGNINYRFCDANGSVKLEKTDTVFNGLSKSEVDLSVLEEGTYSLIIEFGNSIIAKKIMKVN